MENFFVTSDTHLSHKNLIYYSDRPYEPTEEGLKQMNEDLLKHFDELPRNSEVKGVVLLIGVNGATFSDNIPNKQKLISSLVEKYKNKTIYVQEVFPVGKNFENANPDDFNKAIDKASGCHEVPSVSIIA